MKTSALPASHATFTHAGIGGPSGTYAPPARRASRILSARPFTTAAHGLAVIAGPTGAQSPLAAAALIAGVIVVDVFILPPRLKAMFTSARQRAGCVTSKTSSRVKGQA